jgi:hypothetical protein
MVLSPMLRGRRVLSRRKSCSCRCRFLESRPGRPRIPPFAPPRHAHLKPHTGKAPHQPHSGAQIGNGALNDRSIRRFQIRQVEIQYGVRSEDTRQPSTRMAGWRVSERIEGGSGVRADCVVANGSSGEGAVETTTSLFPFSHQGGSRISTTIGTILQFQTGSSCEHRAGARRGNQPRAFLERGYLRSNPTGLSMTLEDVGTRTRTSSLRAGFAQSCGQGRLVRGGKAPLLVRYAAG